MKKLMNKKLNLFGKEVSLMLVVVLALAGFASAALVPYLSNVVSGDAEIASPLVLTGDLSTEEEFPIYGGEEFVRTLNVENLANAEISYSTGFVVTGPVGSNWTEDLDEFHTFELEVLGNENSPFDMKGDCHSINSDNILTCDLGNATLTNLDNRNYTVKVLFHEAIMPGDYLISARVFTIDTLPDGFDFTAPTLQTATDDDSSSSGDGSEPS
ncbi:hypothetical protein KAS08_02750 [Candidatus Pacearchaeota archaeon]|nr:hypothetical protein [Candidatus Pacearchaeota archaeon]